MAEMARRGYRNTLFAGLAQGLFVVLALWPLASHRALLVWLLVLGLVMAGRTWQVSRPLPTGPLRAWEFKFALGAGMAGCVWGIAPVLAMAVYDSGVLLLFAFFLAGITGAVAALHAAQWRAAVTFQACALLPLVALLARFGDRLHYFQAGTVLLYLAILTGATRHIHLTLRRNLMNERRGAQLAAQASRKEQDFHTLVDNLPDPVVRYDGRCRRVYVNPAALRLSGKSVDQLLGFTPAEAPIGERSSTRVADVVSSVLRTGQAVLSEESYPGPDGAPRNYQSHFGPEYDAEGRVVGVLNIMRDVTAQKRHEAELLERIKLEAQLSGLAANIPGFIHTVRETADRHASFPFASAAIRDVLGLRPEDVAEGIEAFRSRIHGEDEPALLRALAQSRQSLTQMRAEIRYQHPDKGERWIEIRAMPQPEAGGGMLWHSLMIDVTQRKAMEQAVVKRETEFRTLAENLPDIVIRYDGQCRRIFVNKNYEKAHGAAAAQMAMGQVATTDGLVRHVGFAPAVAEEFRCRLQKVLTGGLPDSFDHPLTLNGRDVIHHVQLTPEFDERGRVVGVLNITRDVTDARAYQQQLHDLAFYDVLTGLPNRTLFDEHMRQALHAAARGNEPLGLMMLDLDYFKTINDTLGHAIGDRLLLQAGRRIRAYLRAEDLVARLGGDEFALVLPGMRSGADLGETASHLLAALTDPYEVDGHELFISASIGIAVYPDNGGDFDTLLKHADAALYQAKSQGRNNFQFYSADLTERANQRLSLEKDLRKSLANGELEVYYQPKVQLASGLVDGAEALLRWNHPRRGMIPPDRFIAIAEDIGMIVDIGAWVLECACRTAAAWNRSGREPRRIAVNLSPRQFQGRDLKALVSETLMRTGCRPEWIELEITEGLLLNDRDDIRRTLEELHAMGLPIAIDDFGTGYSALSYLNRFPISVLKVDRSFVSHVPGQGSNRALVEAILAMARSLGLTVVAEGVETPQQAAWLKAAGCEKGQGFLWSKPMPEGQFRQIVIARDLH